MVVGAHFAHYIGARKAVDSMGLISIRPAALRTQQADSAVLSVGSAIAATCIVVAFIGVPALVVLGIVALIVAPSAAIMHPAWVALAVLAICWTLALAVGVVLTIIGRRSAAADRRS
ncbi:hypothetical protein [Leekyejoonella antrihumi]|uniref:Uncharacterized protein n=1 Tax=Leekyejoonella antrihumi TaxID=1660198 RepID=A0A563E9P7_9MICO|nr:hypothetical protein [Leekyejoonella antrihumi]TWP39049.1 hypothetical protein FGL98_01295 [Leekyejoonella antrihumi]